MQQLCIATGHMHLETLSVNVRRQTCFQCVVCLGHDSDSEPQCIVVISILSHFYVNFSILGSVFGGF